MVKLATLNRRVRAGPPPPQTQLAVAGRNPAAGEAQTGLDKCETKPHASSASREPAFCYVCETSTPALRDQLAPPGQDLIAPHPSGSCYWQLIYQLCRFSSWDSFFFFSPQLLVCVSCVACVPPNIHYTAEVFQTSCVQGQLWLQISRNSLVFHNVQSS